MDVLDARTAIYNRQSMQPASTWSYRKPGLEHRGEATDDGNGGARVYADRLELRFTPKFKLERSGRFFAAGSCFAREIERALFDAHMEVTSWRPNCPIPQEQFHRYNTFSIVNDFDFAAWRPYDRRNVVQVPDGRYADMTGYIAAGTEDEVVEARRRVIDIHRQALRADAIILTLGLVEAWFDTVTSTYLNLTPFAFFRHDMSRFQMHVTGYQENRRALRKLIKRIRQANETAKIILTVSPVPLTDTFSGQDVIVANSYSKAVLRSVAQDAAGAFEFVDYFPSYEIVTLSSPPASWLPDYRHVRSEQVNHIVAEFVRCYVNGSSGT